MTLTHKIFWFFAACAIVKIATAIAEPVSPADQAAKAAQKAEDTRKGFHCLDTFNGSHRGVEKYVKANLRDPDSYDHIETRISPVSNKGEHVLIMKYRAKNGFGGMNVESLVATVKNETCQATIM